MRNVNNRLRDFCRNRMLDFLKHPNTNAKTHCNISGLPLNSKWQSQFNENFASLLNTLDSVNWHKDQNSKVNKAINTKVSEDSVATDNEIDGFTKVGILCKKHIKKLLFGHLNTNSLKNKREFLEPLIRNHFDKFLVSEKNLIVVFRALNLQFPVIDYFVKIEINMEEVWFFMWIRVFLIFYRSSTPRFKFL